MQILIAQVAKEKGYTIKQLADVMGLSRQVVYSWCANGVKPGYESMELLCNVLECKLDDIFKVEVKKGYSKKALERMKNNKRAKLLKALKELDES